MSPDQWTFLTSRLDRIDRKAHMIGETVALGWTLVAAWVAWDLATKWFGDGWISFVIAVVVGYGAHAVHRYELER